MSPGTLDATQASEAAGTLPTQTPSLPRTRPPGGQCERTLPQSLETAQEVTRVDPAATAATAVGRGTSSPTELQGVW